MGGQFAPAPSGQFGPARGGQFSPASSGQFDRFLHLSGCQMKKPPAEDTTIIKIDLTGVRHDIPFSINNIVHDLRLIKLEANANSFIKYFNGYIGKNYIISINQDKVILFSSDGAYKTIISFNGKGPNDFESIDGWDVDKDERYFLFHSYGRNYINKYNLGTNNFEDNIPFKNMGPITNLQIMNDTLICILPYMYANYDYVFFYQNFSGQVINGKKKNPATYKGPWVGKTPVFIKMTDNSIIFQPSESDTIFKIVGIELKPIISIKNKKLQQKGDLTSGSNISFLNICGKYIILHKADLEIRRSTNLVSVNVLKHDYIIFDSEKNKVSYLNPLSLDYSGVRITIPTLINYINDNQFLAVYQALELKNYFKDALKKEFNNTRRKQITKTYNEISENDNPILITGVSN